MQINECSVSDRIHIVDRIQRSAVGVDVWAFEMMGSGWSAEQHDVKCSYTHRGSITTWGWSRILSTIVFRFTHERFPSILFFWCLMFVTRWRLIGRIVSLSFLLVRLLLVELTIIHRSQHKPFGEPELTSVGMVIQDLPGIFRHPCSHSLSTYILFFV